MNTSLTINGTIYRLAELQNVISQKLNDINLPQWEQDVFVFISQWLDDSETIEVQSSGTTGEPRKYSVTKEAMLVSARKTLEFFNLKQGEATLLCLSVNYIAGKLMVVRAFAGGLNLILKEPSGVPLEDIDIDFVALVPIQVQKQIDLNPDAFKNVKRLIIGGGEVSPILKERLRGISTQVWETYGMTETLTHIALKKLNGNERSDWFSLLPCVTVSKNSNDCLEVEVDGITTDSLITNDIVQFNELGQFKIIGRLDDVINTGGIKVMPAGVEKKIEKWLTRSFVVSSVPDKVFGEKMVLVIEGEAYDDKELKENLKELLFYETPKEVMFLTKLPYTESGKIKRGEVRRAIRSYHN